jgi:hypothetical protein
VHNLSDHEKRPSRQVWLSRGILAGMPTAADGQVWLWRQRSAFDLVMSLLGRTTVREGIRVTDTGVLVRSRNRPDQLVPWSKIEKFEVVGRGSTDAISIIRSDAGPLLAGSFRDSRNTHVRDAPVIKASRVQRELEHERVKAIRAAKRSSRADDTEQA